MSRTGSRRGGAPTLGGFSGPPVDPTATGSAPARSPGANRALGLDVTNLEVVYGDVLTAVRGATLRVEPGHVVAVLGANGAGKTSMLRAISGLLGIHRGRVTKGRVALGGTDITKMDPPTRVRLGLGQVLEGRRIFAELTVEENLRTGAISVRDRAAARGSHERVMALFPMLQGRRSAVAGYLSGGEQQMLAIGRALMANPALLLLDEPSLGLAPKVVERISEVVREINDQGTSVLLVEQNATMALSVATHGYVLDSGRVVMEGVARDLLGNDDIRHFYLGVGDAGRRSLSDVKTYRRKQSWR